MRQLYGEFGRLAPSPPPLSRRPEAACSIAGGINIMLTPEAVLAFSNPAMLSPRGRCRAFDAEGDGCVGSEGGGIVILKPLAAALADGTIRSTRRSSARA